MNLIMALLGICIILESIYIATCMDKGDRFARFFKYFFIVIAAGSAVKDAVLNVPVNYDFLFAIVAIFLMLAPNALQRILSSERRSRA